MKYRAMSTVLFLVIIISLQHLNKNYQINQGTVQTVTTSLTLNNKSPIISKRKTVSAAVQIQKPQVHA